MARKKVTIISCNSTSWVNVIPCISSIDCDLGCFQEMSRFGESVDCAIVAASFAGYQASINGSVVTDKGGLSSGVAIVSPKSHAIFDISSMHGMEWPPSDRHLLMGWHGLVPNCIPIGSIY